MSKDPAIRSQPKLAAKAGIDQTSISRLLLQKGATTVDTLERLAHAIGCQPWELLVDDDKTREEAFRRMLGLQSGSGTTPSQ